MKFLLFCTCITLLSCSKSYNSTNTQSANASLSYKVNGQLVTIENIPYPNSPVIIFIKELKGSLSPQTRYLLNGNKDSDNYLDFSIVTDSLLKTSYHYDSTSLGISSAYGFLLSFNGKKSSPFYDGDFFDITITSYNKGRVSGTFSGTFSPPGVGLPKNSILITDGIINNIQITY